MSRWPTTPLTVLTPVVPGEEDALTADLQTLDRDPSPFASLASTHFVRWVVVAQVGSRLARARRPLSMRYLLFTALSNSPVEDFVEELGQRLGPELDTVWRHCVGYPGHQDGRAFATYLLHNALRIEQRFTAYDADVTEIKRAVGLRRAHAQLARRTQRMPDQDLQRAFLDAFGDDG